MGKQPEFDADGYQSSIRQINNEPLPGNEAKRLSPKEQQQLGIPDPEAVLQALRSRPRRGTPMRIQSALAARKALRLNQRDFAKLIGTSPAALRNWEQGRTHMPLMARKLLRLMEKHPSLVADLVEVDAKR
jgi:DNA-binding transcriptional regulator YiaG